ncbi:MAG: hypothetical protein KF821_09725 [Anaerolineales bacterium]|nr:hypothetical protein [Anaerolineales bacterium]
MPNLEQALDDAIYMVQQGKSLEEALTQYPHLRPELEPLLTATLQICKVAPEPDAAFRARGRSALLAHMAARPRRRGGAPRGWVRLAAGMAAILVALTSATTVMAQTTLPGHPLHPVKLYSEKVWRALQPNPVEADLRLAQRRLEELLAVEGAQVPQALSAYAASLEVLRLDVESLPSHALNTQTALHAQRQQVEALLEASGSTVDDVFSFMPALTDIITNNPKQDPQAAPQPQIQLVVPVVPALGGSLSVTGGSEGVSVEVGAKEGPALSIELNSKEPLSLSDSIMKALSTPQSDK